MADDQQRPLDLSRPADSTPLQHFALLGGCHFRTWWDEKGQSLFIADNEKQHCSTEVWLEGPGEMTLMSDGKRHLQAVSFVQGYPIANLKLSGPPFEIVAVNNQRMIVTHPDTDGSWLVLPFDAQQHVWRFNGMLLVKMDKKHRQR